MSADQIVYDPGLADGGANIAMPPALLNDVYADIVNSLPSVVVGVAVEVGEIVLRGVNSTLGSEPAFDQATDQPIDDLFAITGQTVQRLCRSAGDCAKVCSLRADQPELTIGKRRGMNCAVANTARVFEVIDQAVEGRFMFPPTKQDVYIMSDDIVVTQEKQGAEILFNKLPAAQAIVFTESWVMSKGLDKITIGINGADASMCTAHFEVEGEQVVVAFCSIRDNMGDRGTDQQVLRRAIEMFVDSKNYSTEKRAETIAGLAVSINIHASATLQNFGFEVNIPAEGTIMYDDIVAKYPDEYARRGNKITTAMFLDFYYAGAVRRGNVTKASDLWLGIADETPEGEVSFDKCPLNGEPCHVDYRKETERTVRIQLEQLGVPETIYDQSNAVDPSSRNNRYASNRGEDLAGIELNRTNRTVNAAEIKF